MTQPDSIDTLTAQLAEHAYLADRGLATVLTLALALEKPVPLEGEAGGGKPEAPKAPALGPGGRLVRPACPRGEAAGRLSPPEGSAGGR